MEYLLHRKEGEQFLDANGDPYDGGVFTYFKSVSTPITVYKDAAGATNWGVSVTLDSAGRLTAPIFVDEITGVGAFKEVFKDADGNTIFEFDGYQAAQAVASLTAARPLTPIEADASSVVTMTEAMLGTVQELDCTGGNISFVLLDPGDVDSGEWVGVKHKGTGNSITLTGTVDGASDPTLDTPNDSVILVSNGADSWERLASHRDNTAATHRANTFTVQQIDALASSVAEPRIIRSTNADALAGPILPLDRNSASPAASDLLGRIPFRGRNDNASPEVIDFAAVFARLLTVTDGAEDGELVLQAIVAGALTEIAKIGNGAQLGSPTGGYKGAGTLNLTELYKNGVASWTSVVKTADETKTANTTLAADAALVFPMLANTKYAFRARIFMTSHTTPDFDWRHVGPASPTFVAIHRYNVAPGGSAHNDIAVDTAYSAADNTNGGTGSGIIVLEGVIHNGANAGNFEFHWAQTVSDANQTIVRAGSYIEYRVVA